MTRRAEHGIGREGRECGDQARLRRHPRKAGIGHRDGHHHAPADDPGDRVEAQVVAVVGRQPADDRNVAPDGLPDRQPPGDGVPVVPDVVGHRWCAGSDRPVSEATVAIVPTGGAVSVPDSVWQDSAGRSGHRSFGGFGMLRPPVGVALLGFVALMAGFAYTLMGLRYTGFVVFGPGSIGSGLFFWGLITLVCGILFIAAAFALWSTQPWGWLFAHYLAIFGVLEAFFVVDRQQQLHRRARGRDLPPAGDLVPQRP